MDLIRAAWTDIEDVGPTLAVLPVGSTEQHGPHAPLGTDTFTASAVAAEGVERYDEDIPLAPPVPVGVAAEHREFPGTLWVSPDTFRAYVKETIESLAHHGVDRVVIVNGHGGNVDALRELCADLSRDGTVYAVPFTWFDAIDAAEVAGLEMGHGGPVETSLVRHLHPELVDTDQFETAWQKAADGWGEWVNGVNLAYDTDEFSESGVVGNPEESSPEKGEQLLDSAATALVEVLETVAARDP